MHNGLIVPDCIRGDRNDNSVPGYRFYTGLTFVDAQLFRKFVMEDQTYQFVPSVFDL